MQKSTQTEVQYFLQERARANADKQGLQGRPLVELFPPDSNAERIGEMIREFCEAHYDGGKQKFLLGAMTQTTGGQRAFGTTLIFAALYWILANEGLINTKDTKTPFCGFIKPIVPDGSMPALNKIRDKINELQPFARYNFRTEVEIDLYRHAGTHTRLSPIEKKKALEMLLIRRKFLKLG